jgi:hypothetical protein
MILPQSSNYDSTHLETAMRITFTSKTIALAIALFLLSQLASAATLFVDGKNPAAKDDNPGTEAAPFNTIQSALNKMQAGQVRPWALGSVTTANLEGRSAT